MDHAIKLIKMCRKTIGLPGAQWGPSAWHGVSSDTQGKYRTKMHWIAQQGSYGAVTTNKSRLFGVGLIFRFILLGEAYK